MSLLRSRHTASSESEEKESVQPIDESEQDRIIESFQLDKMQQDALWKHALAIFYGFGAFILLLVIGCSAAFGCSSRAASTLTAGGRCEYFTLPSRLTELYLGSQAAASSSSFMYFLTNLTLLFALFNILSWGYYSWKMNETHVQQSFNERRMKSTSRSTTSSGQEESKEVQEERYLNQTAGARTSSSTVLPIAHSEWQHLRLVQRITMISISLWLGLFLFLLVTHDVSILVGLFFLCPLFLAGLTKLAAKWSDDLEEQIADLRKSKYSYHEL